MSYEQDVTIINAGAAVSPLNFRHWLRQELVRQRFTCSKLGSVEAYIFITKAFITALGRKKLDKIIENGVAGHPWISDVHLVTTAVPVSAREATEYVEEQEFEGSPDPDTADFGTLLLGFTSDILPGTSLRDITEDPACVIRLITEADVIRMGKESTNLGYKVGDYAVVGGKGEEPDFSEPFHSEEVAKAFAKKTYGAVNYVATNGIV